MQIPTINVLQGVVAGLGYGLIALGLVLIYRTNRIINFAHGQLGAVMAVFLLKLTFDLSIPYFPSLILCLVLAAGLGARVVLVGRAYGYGLGAAGGAGVARAIDILRADLVRTLKLLGCASVAQLDRSYVEVRSERRPL